MSSPYASLSRTSTYGSFRNNNNNPYGSVRNVGPTLGEGFPVQNNSELVRDVFPELKGKVNLITAPLADIIGTYGPESELQAVVDASGFSNITNLQRFFTSKGIEQPRVLSLLGWQKDLMSRETEEQAFTALEKLFQEHKRLVDAGQRGLFDLIVMTKDFYSKEHESFTGKYFKVEEEMFDDRRGFRLVRNEAGNLLGVTIQKGWKELPEIAKKFTFPFNPEERGPSSFCLIPATEAEYDDFRAELEKGVLMPPSVGLHNVPVTLHTLRAIADKEAVLAKLKQINLLDARGNIHPEFLRGDKQLRNAFSVLDTSPYAVEFDPAFVKGLAKDLFEREGEVEKTKEVLNALLNHFSANRCVKGTGGHQLHPRLVDLLSKSAAQTPFIPLPKGNGSAGLTPSGNLATPYLPILRFLRAEENVVCASPTTGIFFADSATAVDSAEGQIKTAYWTAPANRSEALSDKLRESNVSVVANYPGFSAAPPSLGNMSISQSMRSFASLVMNNNNNNNISSSSSSSSSALLTHYFENVDELNAEADIPDFGARIFAGAAENHKPGFMGLITLPMSFVSCGVAEFKNRIREKKEEPRWRMQGGEAILKDTHFSLNYDPHGRVAQAGFRLTFDAYLAERAPVNLKPEAKKAMGIDEKAASYAFVYPCEGIGSPAFIQACEQEANYYENLKKALISSLAQDNSTQVADKKIGEKLAALALIGGYAYFDQHGNLIQLKPIVTKATKDTLAIDQAMMSSPQVIPAALKAEFNESVLQFKNTGGIRDGLSNPITAPELLQHGATHFAYVPNGYYPEEIREELSQALERADLRGPGADRVKGVMSAARGEGVKLSSNVFISQIFAILNEPENKQLWDAVVGKLSNNAREVVKQCDTLWRDTAPYGLFIYTFAENKNDCFLAIGSPKPPTVDTSEKQPIKISKVNALGAIQEETVMASLEEECQTCGAPPNVVWHIQPPTDRWIAQRVIRELGKPDQVIEGYFAPPQPAYYRTICCADCDQGLSDEQRSAFVERSQVIGRFPYELNASSIKEDFYTVLHVKPIQQFQNAKLDKMAQSKKSAVTVPDKASLNIPESATQYAYAYPAGKLMQNEENAQLKAFYELGGYVYYNNRGDVVGINEIKARREEGVTKPIGYAPLEEISDKLVDRDRAELVRLIGEQKIPHVSIPNLTQKGVLHFMSIPPNDRMFPSEHGLFVYFNADGSQVFAKKIDPKVREGGNVF